MRRFGVAIAFVVAGVCLCATSGNAAWVPFGAESGPQRPDLEVLDSRSTELQFEVALPGIELTAVEENERRWTRVQMPRSGRIGAVGAPMLPVVRRFVEIPYGADVSVATQVIERDRVVLEEHGLPPDLYPVQLPRPKCDCPEARAWEFSYDETAYRGVVEHPVFSFDGPYGFRNHRLVLVTFSPVTYDVETGTLEVATRVLLTVRFPGGDGRATDTARERLSSPAYDAFLARSTLNLNVGASKDAEWEYPSAAPIPFLIITPPALEADLAPFVEWKTSCGYDVTVVNTNTTGTTKTQIKDYISSLYDGGNAPVYILMIGDSPTPMPTFDDSDTGSSGADGGSDLPYVQMDGDLYPDMMIARWPVDDSTELIAMRDKILHYQQPQPGTSGWLNRALFLAGDDYISAGVTTHEDVIADLMGETTPNNAECELWYGDTEDPTTAELIADLNTGRGWAVYSAHSGPGGWSGDPPLSSGDISSMANTDMYPLGFGHSCSSNEWLNYDDVFGESTVIHADKGFVSYWGGSNSTYWDTDDWIERGFFDSLIPEDLSGNLITLDGQHANVAACYSGLTEVTLQGGGNPGEAYCWYEYNLNGDPTLDPFTHQPVAMTVGAPTAVPPAATDTFTVTAEDSARGSVEGALVGVTQDGALLGAGYTDGTGTATFHIDAPSPGSDLLVRVTAHNHYPTDASTMVGAGSDGVVTLDADVYACDGLVTIDVFDDDLDGNGTQDVILSTSPSGDSATVTLNELGGDVVRFQGTAQLGTDLTTVDGDTLTMTYTDEDDGQSPGPVDKTDAADIDCAGPLISGVWSKAGTSAASVRFTTDEPGTTVVVWGSTKPPTQTVSDTTLVTDHVVSVSGLSDCTRYWFFLESEDALGNLTVDDNGGAYYFFDTADPTVVQLFSEPMDADPGWSTTGEWAFGTPQATGVDGDDPPSGADGPYVYGYNNTSTNNGYYTNGMPAYALTTTPFDISTVTPSVLRFQRWLGVEHSTYDHATVQVSVDGGGWTELWHNPSGWDNTIEDTEWIEQELTLPDLTAGTTMQLRWVMGPTDGSVTRWGWNIDNVVIEGVEPCQTCTEPPAWTSGDGLTGLTTVTEGSCGLSGFVAEWSEAESTCAQHVRYRVWVQKAADVDFGLDPTFEGIDATSFTVMGVTPGTTYAVAVRAYDEYGNEDANTTDDTIVPSGAMSGDVNGDTLVDGADIDALVGSLFQVTKTPDLYDVDCSGSVDAGDLAAEIAYQANGLY